MDGSAIAPEGSTSTMARMRWYTINESATRAGVSAGAVREARRLGRFPSARRGAAVGARDAPWLIREDELDAAGFGPKAPVDSEEGDEAPIFLEQRLVEIRAELRCVRALVAQSVVTADEHELVVRSGLEELAELVASVELRVAAFGSGRDRQSWFGTLRRRLLRSVGVR